MDDHQEVVERTVSRLPVLDKDAVNADDSCPICLLPFSEFFGEKGEGSDPDAGVTVLDACGHVFCRKDLAEWIRTLHGSCPACRDVFLDIRPRSESDDESSDGGEYIPEDDDEDDAFLGPDEMEVDDFDEFDEHFGSGIDADLIDVDLDSYRSWELQEEMEWGLTDGESESSPSEGDMSWNHDADAVADDVDIVVSDSEGGAESIAGDIGRATEEEEAK